MDTNRSVMSSRFNIHHRLVLDKDRFSHQGRLEVLTLFWCPASLRGRCCLGKQTSVISSADGCLSPELHLYSELRWSHARPPSLRNHYRPVCFLAAAFNTWFNKSQPPFLCSDVLRPPPFASRLRQPRHHDFPSSPSN